MWAWALLPISLTVLGTLGIFAVCAVAVSNGTVNITATLPYISTCGNFNPQSCFFSQLANICAFQVLWIVAIRFYQIRDCGLVTRGKTVLNVISLILGIMCALGTSFTGNFQLLHVLHLTGAGLAFFGGMLYFWLQVFLHKDTCCVAMVRFILCLSGSIFIVIMFILYFNGYHSIGAACEWMAVLIFFILFGLFAVDFQHIKDFKVVVQFCEGKVTESGGEMKERT
uniref:CWH43-like N-terminal domain-containing protein n=1 Tax=Scleropages formosus TaxID=113540 RepID=A0A8C9SYM6_SCLFO